MRLRSKLGLSLALLVVPFAVGMAVFQLTTRRGAFEEGTATAVVDRMEAGERALCEEAPGQWPRLGRGGRAEAGRRGEGKRGRAEAGRRGEGKRGRRGRRGPGERGFRAWAYDASYRSENPRAPEFPPELRAELNAGDDFASAPGRRGRLVAVRMPWDEGPCAIVLVRRPEPPVRRIATWSLVPSLVVSAAAVLIAVLAAGPMVRRIRLLTDAVRRPPEDATPLDTRGRDEIAELATAFEESRRRIRTQIEELERRDETLRTYMLDTTHDVMIPLTVLQGHLTAIERSVEAGRPVEESRVRDALGECHYLASLVRNMNAAARLEASAAEPRRDAVDLNALVERVAGRHGTFARQQDVVLEHAIPEGPTVVYGDVTLVEQAAGNLVHNAVRYNRPGGHVALVLERRADRFVLRVADDGPGIPPEELRRVAERGYRGDRARSRHPHGMGLGLHIARQVAERHGWDLRFESPGEGGLVVTLEGALAEASAGD